MNLMTNGQFHWRVILLHHLINKEIGDNASAYIMRFVNIKPLYKIFMLNKCRFSNAYL